MIDRVCMGSLRGNPKEIEMKQEYVNVNADSEERFKKYWDIDGDDIAIKLVNSTKSKLN